VYRRGQSDNQQIRNPAGLGRPDGLTESTSPTFMIQSGWGIGSDAALKNGHRMFAKLCLNIESRSSVLDIDHVDPRDLFSGGGMRRIGIIHASV
jgi:hypothetical protein